MRLAYALWRLLFCASLLLSLAAAPPARVRLDPDPNLSVFVPLIRTGERGLYGNVTENGVPAAGITLRLYRWTSGSALQVATTTTAANGSYSFTGLNLSELGGLGGGLWPVDGWVGEKMPREPAAHIRWL